MLSNDVRRPVAGGAGSPERDAGSSHVLPQGALAGAIWSMARQAGVVCEIKHLIAFPGENETFPIEECPL